MIDPSQRPQPDNTQHLHDTDIHAPAGFEPAVSASERPKTHALRQLDHRDKPDYYNQRELTSIKTGFKRRVTSIRCL